MSTSYYQPELDPAEETVAVGDLFKVGGNNGGRKTWNLRRFYLIGCYLKYHDNVTGVYKGKWDIRNCSVVRFTPDECKMKDALYAFGLIDKKGKKYIMCASNERSRMVWMRCISEQMEEFTNDLRIHLLRGEVTVADGIVKRKSGYLGFFTTVRLIISNFPKIAFIDPTVNAKKDEWKWKELNMEPPKCEAISDTRFQLTIGTQIEIIEDVEKGAAFWENLFRSLPDISVYVAARFRPENINGRDSFEREQVATLEIGDIERSANNLRKLKDAKGKARDLVTAINSKLIELDKEIDWELESNDPVYAKEIADSRDKFKTLKDSAIAMLRNLETISEDSVVLDMEPIEATMEESDRLLEVLGKPVVDPVTTPPAFEIMKPAYKKHVVESDELQFTDTEQKPNISQNLSIHSNLAPLFDPVDIENECQSQSVPTSIGSSTIQVDELNSNSNGHEAGPFSISNQNYEVMQWEDERTKRVLVQEVFDLIEGADDSEILKKRPERIAKVETEMEEEYNTRGTIAQDPITSATAIGRETATEQYNQISVRQSVSTVLGGNTVANVIISSVAITPENFNENDADIRPTGWWAVRARRVQMRAQHKMDAITEDDDVNDVITKLVDDEEERMVCEVLCYGKIELEAVLEEVKRDVIEKGRGEHLERSLVTGVLSSDEGGTRSENTVRVTPVKDYLTNNGRIDRDIPNGVSSDGGPQFRGSIIRQDQIMQSFLTEANSLLVNLTAKISASVAKASQKTKSPSKKWPTLHELKKMAAANVNSVNRTPSEKMPTHFVPNSQSASTSPKVNLNHVRGALKPVADSALKSDMQQLISKINTENIDVKDSNRRPAGWLQVQLRRVLKEEGEVRSRGTKEKDIKALREKRVQEVGKTMVEEVSVADRIRALNQKKSAPLFPVPFSNTTPRIASPFSSSKRNVQPVPLIQSQNVPIVATIGIQSNPLNASRRSSITRKSPNLPPDHSPKSILPIKPPPPPIHR